MVTHVEVRTLGSLLWVLLVLLSWIGWGMVAGRWVGRRKADLGLSAAWGMALTALAGGPLNTLGVCSPLLIGSLTVGGAVLAVISIARRMKWTRRIARLRLKAWVPYIPLILVGAFILIGSLSCLEMGFNTIDDFPFYLVMPVKMLQTGAAIDPLNGRRLLTFGGFSFLQAQVMVGGTPWNAYAVDIGLSSFIVVALLAGASRRRGVWRWAICGLAAVCWFYPLPRVNTAAALGITALLLAMLRTVQLADNRPANRAKFLILAALVATAACTFRDNILVLPPVFFLLYFIHRWLRLPTQRQATVRELMMVIAVGVVALLPWSVALYRACGSFLYPLMAGNHHDFENTFVMRGTSVLERFRFAGATLVLPGFRIIYIPILFLIARKQWLALQLFIATLVMSAATAFNFTVAQTSWLERFCVPALFASTLYGLEVALRPYPGRKRAIWYEGVVVVLAGMAILWPAALTKKRLKRQGLAFQDAIEAPAELFRPEVLAEYANIQASVPAGKTLGVALDYSVLLDFRRNPILCLDVPGGASIQGNWPFGRGPAAVQNFLAAQGLDYVLFRDFNMATGMYSADVWVKMDRTHDRSPPRVLDMMTNLTLLARTDAVVYRHDGYTVLKIR